jgi:hypothetical protein
MAVSNSLLHHSKDSKSEFLRLLNKSLAINSLFYLMIEEPEECTFNILAYTPVQDVRVPSWLQFRCRDGWKGAEHV